MTGAISGFTPFLRWAWGGQEPPCSTLERGHGTKRDWEDWLRVRWLHNGSPHKPLEGQGELGPETALQMLAGEALFEFSEVRDVSLQG